MALGGAILLATGASSGCGYLYKGLWVFAQAALGGSGVATGACASGYTPFRTTPLVFTNHPQILMILGFATSRPAMWFLMAYLVAYLVACLGKS